MLVVKSFLRPLWRRKSRSTEVPFPTRSWWPWWWFLMIENRSPPREHRQATFILLRVSVDSRSIESCLCVSRSPAKRKIVAYLCIYTYLLYWFLFRFCFARFNRGSENEAKPVAAAAATTTVRLGFNSLNELPTFVNDLRVDQQSSSPVHQERRLRLQRRWWHGWAASQYCMA